MAFIYFLYFLTYFFISTLLRCNTAMRLVWGWRLNYLGNDEYKRYYDYVLLYLYYKCCLLYEAMI
jgi:hypothetical protein